MDIHTLHIAHAVLLVLFIPLTLINARMHRRVAGMRWFAACGIFLASGAVLVALRGHIPDGVSVVGGDMAFPCGYFCLHRSTSAFFADGGKIWRIQMVLIAMLGLGLIEYGLFSPNVTIRLLLLSVVLAVQLALTAGTVARNTPSHMRAAGGLMTALLVLLCGGNLLRFGTLIAHPVSGNYLHAGSLLAWIVLNTAVLQCAVLVAFVWMTAARLHHDLEVQALTDPLTGLLNRRALELMAGNAIATSRRTAHPLSAILLDLDNFKSINDSYGHLCGDAALSAIARCLERQVRPGDIVARLGGDEFAIVLNETGIAEAQEVAERLRCALEQFAISFDDHALAVTGSWGVAELVDRSRDWKHLLARCDKALYAVKNGGGNCVITDCLQGSALRCSTTECA